MPDTVGGPAQAGAASRQAGRWRRWVAVIGLAAVGAGGAGAAGVGLYRESARTATPAEAKAAGQAEVASRWRRLPAGQVFPAAVSYVTTNGVSTRGRRAGIARPASCQTALDPAAVRALNGHGCSQVLRSAYVDASGTLVATVGAAVMPGPSAASAAGASLVQGGTRAGLRAVSFPGTETQLFGDGKRVWFYARAAGPYVVMVTVGYLAGESGSSAATNPAVSDLGVALANQEVSVLTSGGNPCHRPGVRC